MTSISPVQSSSHPGCKKGPSEYICTSVLSCDVHNWGTAQELTRKLFFIWNTYSVHLVSTTMLVYILVRLWFARGIIKSKRFVVNTFQGTIYLWEMNIFLASSLIHFLSCWLQQHCSPNRICFQHYDRWSPDWWNMISKVTEPKLSVAKYKLVYLHDILQSLKMS